MTRYDPFAYGEVRLDPNQQKEQQPPQDAEDMLFDPGEATKQGPPADANWALLSEQENAAPSAPVDTSVAMEFGNEILGEDVDADPLYGDVHQGDVHQQDVYQQDAQHHDMPSHDMSGNYGMDDDLGAPPEGMAPLSDLMNSDTGGDAAAFAMPQDGMAAPELIDCDVPDETSMAAEPAPQQAAAQASPMGGRVQRRPLPPPAVKPTGRRRAGPAMPRRRSRGALALVVPMALCAGGGTAGTWFWVMQNNPVMGGIIGAGTLVSALFCRLLLRG